MVDDIVADVCANDKLHQIDTNNKIKYNDKDDAIIRNCFKSV